MIISSATRRHRHPVIMRPTSHGSLARANSRALRAICLFRRTGTKKMVKQRNIIQIATRRRFGIQGHYILTVISRVV